MAQFHKLTIKKIKRETDNAVSIEFDVPEKLSSEFKFIAGQYITTVSYTHLTLPTNREV